MGEGSDDDTRVHGTWALILESEGDLKLLRSEARSSRLTLGFVADRSTAMRKSPSFFWRAATLLGLWFIMFGVATALTPLYMEVGYDMIRLVLGVAIFRVFG